MKAIKVFLIWLFGLSCGLSIASWLIANERIGDAIVFVYFSNGFALLALVALLYVMLNKAWKHTKM
jgi:hypothetical protein